ncbi:MAG: type II CAAX endopeptidase family protein [Cyanobacteria bacterium J06614_10]
MSQTAKKVILWVRRQGAWIRIGCFLVLLLVVWSPVAASVYWSRGWFYDSDTAEIVSLVLLYVGFLLGLPVWGSAIHGWGRPFNRCGLSLQVQTLCDGLVALVIGVLGVFSLFGLASLLGWATPTPPSPRLARFVVEGLIVALAIGLAEELLFRGWVLAELEENYTSGAVLVMNALFFAGTHFIKPWSEILRTLPQFLGLVVLGMALVWARRSPTGKEKRTRLGYPIGLHAGLVWGYYIVNVGGLSAYTGRAPAWVTGIDNNPLAGLLGVVLLGLVARQFAKTAQPKTQPDAPT